MGLIYSPGYTARPVRVPQAGPHDLARQETEVSRQHTGWLEVVLG